MVTAGPGTQKAKQTLEPLLPRGLAPRCWGQLPGNRRLFRAPRKGAAGRWEATCNQSLPLLRLGSSLRPRDPPSTPLRGARSSKAGGHRGGGARAEASWNPVPISAAAGSRFQNARRVPWQVQMCCPQRPQPRLQGRCRRPGSLSPLPATSSFPGPRQLVAKGTETHQQMIRCPAHRFQLEPAADRLDGTQASATPGHSWSLIPTASWQSTPGTPSSHTPPPREQGLSHAGAPHGLGLGGVPGPQKQKAVGGLSGMG